MLQVIDLACRRGDRRLFSGLSFDLEPGTLLHVRGRNGSGKTTLLRALCGLVTPDAGQIRWQGEDNRSHEDFYADLLYCGHSSGIKDDLTGIENLRVTTTLNGSRVGTDRLRSALVRMGLAGYEELPTRVLSQGQRKRVALTRLLVSKTPLWILDEPFTALDTAAVDRLQRLITEHVTTGGSVVLTTHREVRLPTGQLRCLYLGEAVQRPVERLGKPGR